MSWNDVTDDQICEFTGTPGNSETARYERILQVRLKQQVSLLSEKLKGLMEQMNRSTERAADKADELKIAMQASADTLGQRVNVLVGTMRDSTASLSARTDELRMSYERIADSQGRQQRALFVLSVVVACATVLYTWITWQQVKAAREANAIARVAQISETPRSETAVNRVAFDLRSACGAYAVAWAKDKPAGEWGAHYNSKTNRCFLKQDVDGKDISLFDPQEHSLLASCSTPSGTDLFCQIGGKAVTKSQGLAYITESMTN